MATRKPADDAQQPADAPEVGAIDIADPAPAAEPAPKAKAKEAPKAMSLDLQQVIAALNAGA